MSNTMMRGNLTIDAIDQRSQGRGQEEAYYTIDPNDSPIDYHQQAPRLKHAIRESGVTKGKNFGISGAAGTLSGVGPPMNSVNRRFKQNPRAAVREAVARSLNPAEMRRRARQNSQSLAQKSIYEN